MTRPAWLDRTEAVFVLIGFTLISFIIFIAL